MFSISIRNQTNNANCKCHNTVHIFWVSERKHILKILLYIPIDTYLYDIFLGDLILIINNIFFMLSIRHLYRSGYT